MNVNILGLWRVVLYHTVFFAPEHVFDATHLGPSGISIFFWTYRYVFPSHAV